MNSCGMRVTPCRPRPAMDSFWAAAAACVRRWHLLRRRPIVFIQGVGLRLAAICEGVLPAALQAAPAQRVSAVLQQDSHAKSTALQHRRQLATVLGANSTRS